jgi:hypothetical protein
MGSTIAAKTGIPGAENLMQGLAMGLNDSSMNPSSALPQMIENRRTEARDAKQRNMTAEYIRKMGHDDLAGLVDSGGLTAAQALTLAQGGKGGEDWQYFQNQGGIYAVNKKTQELKTIRDPSKDGTSGASESGLIPQWVEMEDGSVRPALPRKDGTIGLPVLPPGAKRFLPPTRGYETETELGSIDSRTGLPVGARIDKNVAEGQIQTETGKAAGKAISDAPGTLRSANRTLGYIEAIRNDPARVGATGMSSVFNSIPGRPEYDFQARVDQLVGGAFLTAIDDLVGMGALSDAEGQTAKDSIQRLKTASSEPGFLKALDDYEEIVAKAQARAAKLLEGRDPLTALPSGAPPPSSGLSAEELLKKYPPKAP